MSLVLLWTGRRRLGFSSFVATFLSVFEVASLLLAVVTLGWIGVAIVVVISVVAAVVWAVVLAVKKQAILVNASVQGADVSVDDAEEIWRWMRVERAFAAVPPLERAELIRALSAQARNPAEIRAMAPPIAKLALVFDSDLGWLAPRFDQLLRLYDKEAADATDVADKLTRGTQVAASSFEEMVEAMLAAAQELKAPANEAVDPGQRGNGFWEELRANAEIQVHQTGARGVRLDGGPMDGWLVLGDAPSLAPDWYRTWPSSVRGRFEPGSYELADSGTWAVWKPLDRQAPES